MTQRSGMSVLALSLLVAACSGTGVGASSGVLTGHAQACAGLAYVATANLQVYEGDLLIAARRVPNGSTYRFVLPPGRYYITNTRSRESGLGRSAAVVAGELTHVDVPDLCS